MSLVKSLLSLLDLSGCLWLSLGDDQTFTRSLVPGVSEVDCSVFCHTWHKRAVQSMTLKHTCQRSLIDRNERLRFCTVRVFCSVADQ